MTLLTALAFFLLGALAGAVGLARWWTRRMNDPEAIRELLRGLHGKAHPHLLQVSLTDPTPICPCCGWTEPRVGDL